MSTYNENSKNEEKQNVASGIQKLLVEMGKSPNTYKKYAEKTVEEVAKEIEKGETYWEMNFDESDIYIWQDVNQNGKVA